MLHEHNALASKSHTRTALSSTQACQDRGSEHPIVGGGRVPLQLQQSNQKFITTPMSALADNASSSSSAPRRPTYLRRSLSWPLVSSDGSGVHPFATFADPFNRRAESKTHSKLTAPKKPSSGPDDDDLLLDRDPDAYFLSPMDPHDEYWLDWSDEEEDTDDEDSDEEIPWNAGIVDFTLFQHDRHRAVETQRTLPSQWDDLLSSQRTALQRATERTQTLPRPIPASQPRFLRDDDVPGLTPDHSPDLRNLLADATHSDDDLEHLGHQDRQPSNVIITLTPPGSNVHRTLSAPDLLPRSFHQKQPLRQRGDASNAGDEDDEQSLYFGTPRKQQLNSPPKSALRRPGLRGTRTMSGKVHAWRPPSAYIATVNEDPEAEEQADD